MPMKFLKQIAIGIGLVGGLGTVIALNSVPYLLNKSIAKSEHYTQALNLLVSNPEAIRALGEPIKPLKVKVTDKEQYGTDGEKIWIKVPVVGSNDSGYLYYEFVVPEEEKSKNYYNKKIESIKLTTVELTVKKKEKLKLVLKKPD